MHHARIDRLACGDSPIHRLDSRVKLLSVLTYTVVVIAAPPTAVSRIIWYGVWPFALLVIGRIPLRFVLKHLLLVSPFIAVLAASSLFFDRTPVEIAFGPWRSEVSRGLLRCLSILSRFTVTMTALIALMATTRFNDLLAGLSRLGVPRLLVLQLSFLYRYIFLLINNGHHLLMARAGRRLRSLGFRREMQVAASMIGALFIDSIDRAQRITTAMEARGFDGDLPTLRPMQIEKADWIFALLLACFLVLSLIVTRGLT